MELHGTGHGGSWMLQQMEGEACSYMRQGMGELDVTADGVTWDRAWGELDVTADAG